MIRGGGTINEEILVRYVTGEATAAERADVDAWQNEREENRAYLESLATIWGVSSESGVHSSVNPDKAWARFQQRTQKKSISLAQAAMRIAAGLLLFIGLGSAIFFIANRPQHSFVSMQNINAPVGKQMAKKVSPAATDTLSVVKQREEDKGVAVQKKTEEADKVNAATKQSVEQESEKARTLTIVNKPITAKTHTKFTASAIHNIFKYDKTKDFIRNSTPCPIEICINQTLKCPNERPLPVSTCRVLEPDEAGQLKYKDKASGKVRNCKATVDEIIFKRVNTDEMIVLDAASQPSSAEEFFSYMTGAKKGDISAGMFHTDCDNNKDDCGLLFDNSKLILQ